MNENEVAGQRLDPKTPSLVVSNTEPEQAGRRWIGAFITTLRQFYRDETGERPLEDPSGLTRLDHHTFSVFRNEPLRLRLVAFTQYVLERWAAESITLPDFKQQHRRCRDEYCDNCNEGWTYPEGETYDSWTEAEDNEEPFGRQFVCRRDCEDFLLVLTDRMSERTLIDTAALSRHWSDFNKLWLRGKDWVPPWLETPLDPYLVRL